MAIEQEMAMHAKMVLDNPAFMKAVEDIRTAILQAWAGTKPTATADREEYQRRYVALTTVVALLQDYMSTGVMNNMRIAEETRLQKAMEKVKNFWDPRSNTEGIV
jgi:hypothetical protein